SLEVPEVGVKKALFVDDRRDAGQKDPLEITLHDRRQTVEPHRKDQNQRLGRAQTLNVTLDLPRVEIDVDIGSHLSGRQDRIEFFGIEIEIVDLMSAGPQRLDDPDVGGGDEARV